MFFVLALITFIGIFLYLDLYKSDDVLNPSILICAKFLLTYLIPALLYNLTPIVPRYIPKDALTGPTVDLAKWYLLICLSAFFFTYHLSLKYLPVPNLKNFRTEFISKYHSYFQSALATISFTLVFSLIFYSIFENGAYYRMSGYGIWLWVYTLFAYIPAFVFLAHKKYQKRAIALQICNFILFYFVLERGTQTILNLFCAMLILKNYIKISKKVSVLAIATVVILFLSRKMMAISHGNPQWPLQHVMTYFFGYELGRFEYFVGAFERFLSGHSLPYSFIVRYIPFLSYFPFFDDIVREFNQAHELLLVGKHVSAQGGLPLTGHGEATLILGPLLTIFMHSCWGVFIAFIYKIYDQNRFNDVLPGIYATTLYSSLGLGLNPPVNFVYAMVFCLLMLKVTKNPESA